MPNAETPKNDEIFDVQYDIYETLFDRIREMVERQKDDLTALKKVRDHLIQAVAAMENADFASIYRDMENVRTE